MWYSDVTFRVILCIKNVVYCSVMKCSVVLGGVV